MPIFDINGKLICSRHLKIFNSTKLAVNSYGKVLILIVRGAFG